MGNRKKDWGEMRPSVITPDNGKRVSLRIKVKDEEGKDQQDILWMTNFNGVTVGSRGLSDGRKGEMLQNRSAFDAMVNSLTMLFGMELMTVEYMEEGEVEQKEDWCVYEK